MEKESHNSKEANIQNWNKTLEEALLKFRNNPEEGAASLEKLFDNIGLELNNQHQSLMFEINVTELNPDAIKKLNGWGLKTEGADTISIAINPPKRESTGTHGSGERQKMIEAIKTASIDYDAQDNPLIKINLFGRFTGLYHKLVDTLTVQLTPKQIRSITVGNTSEWKKILASSANSVLQSEAAKRWPEFVKKQVEELIKGAEE